LNILTKLFSKGKNPVDSSNKVITPVSMPDMQKSEYLGANSKEKTILRDQAERNGGVQVDIPLDQDLSEVHGVVTLSGKEVDFDFGDHFEDNTIYPKPDFLAINPLKSFSHPVDINLDRLHQKGFITPHSVNTLLGNTFRMIKRPLLNNVMGKGATVLDNANLIMLTSSYSGEGKTFSAINLAISIAMERDKHVLLIDADVNKPSHHEVFGFDADYGLTDLLLDKVKDMSRVLYKTNIPSLTLMPAGRKTSRATELLASESMEKFIKEISSFYKDRIIIFDAPPLLLPTEASVLASHMGQVIVVVEAEKTRRQDVKRSLGMLSNKIVLLLLNQSREKSLVGNYGYYKYEDQT
jgi:protein-tyrosine kinase